MTSRVPLSCTLLMLAAALPADTRVAHAQDAVKVPATAIPSPTFRIERSEGTPDETAFIQTLKSRLNTKANDDAFWKRVSDAVSQRNPRSAKSMMGEIVQLPADQVWIGSQAARIGGIKPPSQSIFHLASLERSAVPPRERVNPFAIIFSAGGSWYCYGTVAGCTAVSTKMGLKVTWS